MPKTNPITHNGQTYWPDANGWYPIECAPKGKPMGDLVDFGPEIDLFAGSRRYTNCSWAHSKQAWVMVVRYLTKGGQRKTTYMQIKTPTHWQPLPQPPVASQQGGE